VATCLTDLLRDLVERFNGNKAEFVSFDVTQKERKTVNFTRDYAQFTPLVTAERTVRPLLSATLQQPERQSITPRDTTAMQSEGTFP